MEDIIDIHLNGQLYLYMSNAIKKQDYDIYYSDLIDDEYWNFAYLKNKDVSLNEIFDEIKFNMCKLDRKPIIYIQNYKKILKTLNWSHYIQMFGWH